MRATLFINLARATTHEKANESLRSQNEVFRNRATSRTSIIYTKGLKIFQFTLRPWNTNARNNVTTQTFFLFLRKLNNYIHHPRSFPTTFSHKSDSKLTLCNKPTTPHDFSQHPNFLANLKWFRTQSNFYILTFYPSLRIKKEESCDILITF